MIFSSKDKRIDFIQVGANVGNTEQDIIWQLVRTKGWKGILVEPHPTAFQELLTNYQDVNGLYFENIALSNINGICDLWFDPYGDNQIASLRPTHSREKNTEKVVVPCMTLSALINRYGLWKKEFELLQLDCEGTDDLILMCTDFTHIRPKYIRFEHIHLGVHNGTQDRALRDCLYHLSKFDYVPCEDMYNELRPESERGIDTMVRRLL